MTLRPLPALCVVLAALIGPLPPSTAQGSLPSTVITATTLDEQQAADLSKFVQDWLPRLSSEDPQELKRGREQLLDPLRNPGATVAFRQKYTELLLPDLQKFAVSEDPRQAVNALRVAGELATADAANLLVQHLDDKSVAARYAAVAGLARTFASVQASTATPGILPAAVQSLVDRVGQQVLNEKDPQVLDASVRALISATALTRTGFDAVRPHAFATMCKVCGQRAKAAAASPGKQWLDELPAMLRAATAARDALAQANPALALSATPGGSDHPRGTVGDAAELGGHLLATVVRRIRDLPPEGSPERDQAVDLANLVEQNLTIAVPRMGGQYQAVGLANDLKSGTPQGDTEFVRKAVNVFTTLRGLNLGPFMDK